MNIRELESRILDLLEGLLQEAGLHYRVRQRRGAGPHLVLDLNAVSRKHIPIVIEVCANPRLAPVMHAAEKARSFSDRLEAAIPAVAVPRIGPGLKQALRRQRVGYLSLDGQVYLAGGGILIDRQVPSLSVPHQWAQDSSLFADKSSLLLRYLLSRSAAPVGIRDVAASLGMSPALASRLVAKLRSDRYLVQEGEVARLADRAALLGDWAEYYRRRAKRQRELRCYLHARDVSSVLERLARHGRNPDLPHWGLSFQAGASLVEPYAFFSEVHVLIGGPLWEDAAEALRRRFDLEPASREANVILVEPSYKHSWAYGLREVDGLPVVSDVQLYLDLCAYPRRGSEQASRIRERILSLERQEVAS